MILNKINHPNDMHSLSEAELGFLAKELRKVMIEVTAENGGHLAPSLGATDFTIALLKVFNLTEDSIVWDVGHQAYAYKILTGRRDQFHTLRRYGGISGFINRAESPFDSFGVGHSSTSISAAVGIASANEYNGKAGHSIAVIGDGALTGGMAFEALNHAGHLQLSKLIVILNDNEMSISKNVGALQSYLARVLVSRSYNTLKKQVWGMLHNLPGRVRNRFIQGAQKLEENLINMFVPNVVFEDFGFKYVGPIDGHDIPKLVRIFQKAKDNMDGPVLIHIVTKKGRGYVHAEKNAAKFHGISPFDPVTGELLKPSGTTYSKLLGQTLSKLAIENPRIIAITAAMSDGTGLTEFERLFPKRFFDVGIAEQHAVTFAAGLATRGLKPFVAVYSTFMQRSLDQLIHDVALQKLPVVFCLDRAGLVGEDGATHHGVFDLSYLSFIPNMTIMAPADAVEFQAMLAYAADFTEGPLAIRYPRGKAPERERNMIPLSHGKAEMVQQGKGIAFIGVGEGFLLACQVRDMLEAACPGKTVTLINLRYVKPLDIAMLDALKADHTLVITIEDNALIGGAGKQIQSYFAGNGVKVLTFGIPDFFVPHGQNEQLFELLGLTPDEIMQQIRGHRLFPWNE